MVAVLRLDEVSPGGGMMLRWRLIPVAVAAVAAAMAATVAAVAVNAATSGTAEARYVS